jgi:hypothetical protein
MVPNQMELVMALDEFGELGYKFGFFMMFGAFCAWLSFGMAAVVHIAGTVALAVAMPTILTNMFSD